MDHRKKRICVAKIVSVHGVRGAVKIKSFTEEPRDFNLYGDLFDQEDSIIKITPVSNKLDIIIANIEGIYDRDIAQKFVGKELYIARDVLPLPQEDEYYIEDLIGLDVLSKDGEKCGVIKYLHNFGGGDIVEIHFMGNHYKMFAFTKENFPEINFKKNFIKTSLF